MRTKTTIKEDNSDLDYLSEIGYEITPVNASDIRNMRKRVNSLHLFNGMGSHLLLFVFGIALGTAVFYFFFSSPAKPVVKEPIFAEGGAEKTKRSQQAIIVLDTVELSVDNFVNPVQNVYKKAGSSNVLSATESVDPAELTPKEISSIPEENLEQNLKFIINSQVFYLHDLKVTNYTTLYFRKNEFLGLDGTPADGLSSERENHSSLKQEATMYLHEEIANGMLQYKKGKYDEAFQTLKLVRTYNSEDLNCDFYSGMCLYQKGNFSKAIPFFDNCIDADNNAFYQEALFYKALSLRELGDGKAALPLLERISAEKGFYEKRAEELLRRKD